jgi:hypothetical protein
MLALEMAFFWLSGSWVSGTFAATPVEVLGGGTGIDGEGPPGSGSYASWLISAADGDTLMVFPHGFKQTSPSGDPNLGFTPDLVQIQPLASVALGARPNWGAFADTTNVTLLKQGTVGSGGTPAAKLVIMRPQSHIE